MKQLFQVIIIGLIIGCAPKIATKTKDDFQSIKLAIASEAADYLKLKDAFPEFQVTERAFFKAEVNTKREKAAIRLAESELTELITNKDNSCGLIKVVKIQQNAKMRVSYIYLGDMTNEGEQLADKILQAYQNGKPFAELAKQYSKDGGKETGGDLNWFDEKSMIKDFTQAIRKHKMGDVFKTPTEAYGWYVISYTHELQERTEYEIIEIKKESCVNK